MANLPAIRWKNLVNLRCNKPYLNFAESLRNFDSRITRAHNTITTIQADLLLVLDDRNRMKNLVKLRRDNKPRNVWILLSHFRILTARYITTLYIYDSYILIAKQDLFGRSDEEWFNLRNLDKYKYPDSCHVIDKPIFNSKTQKEANEINGVSR